LRTNERIRISPIRLIDQNDDQIGIVEVKQAQSMAREAGLDLVEVAPMAKPPVCRIMDYGKFKYAQRKKDKQSKAKRHETELKEIRIKTPKIGEHDLEIKVSRARKFIERGDRVQFSLRFRGRELAHIDEGQKVFQRIIGELDDISKVIQPFRREGRRITMTLAPDAKKQAAGQRKKEEEAQAESEQQA
jgi:translation initiation factor IF-3